MNVNYFGDNNFVIATLFRDYHITQPSQTIHIVAPPTILTHDVGYHFNAGVGVAIQYKKKEVVWITVLADLISNFCSLS